MEKDRFINEILDSTNGISQVLPNENLFSGIEDRIRAGKKVSATTIWWIAASVAILIALNISALASDRKATEAPATAAFAATLDKSNQLY